MLRSRVLAVFATALCSAACQVDDPPNGELGNGSFYYHCDSDSDPVCDDLGPDASTTRMPLPAAVGVGSRFSIEYQASLTRNDPGGSTTIESASSDILAQTEPFATSFKAIKPGLVAILARRGDTITDFIHMRVKAVAGVRVDTEDGEREAIDTLELEKGASASLRAFAFDETDAQLAGALPAKWETSDENVVAIDGLATDNQVSLSGVDAGTATVTITLGGNAHDVEVTIIDAGGSSSGGGGAP